MIIVPSIKCFSYTAVCQIKPKNKNKRLNDFKKELLDLIINDLDPNIRQNRPYIFYFIKSIICNCDDKQYHLIIIVYCEKSVVNSE